MDFPNPFKKKDNNDFKMDETSIPSLSGSHDSSSGLDKPTPGLGSTAIPMSGEFDPSKPSEFATEMNSSPDISSDNSFKPTFNPGNSSSDFSTPSSPFDSPSNVPSNNIDNSNLHQDISKAKLDAIDSKVSLVDAKLSAIEGKIDIITKILMEEVSEETKKKLKLKAMMDNIKEAS